VGQTTHDHVTRVLLKKDKNNSARRLDGISIAPSFGTISNSWHRIIGIQAVQRAPACGCFQITPVETDVVFSVESELFGYMRGERGRSLNSRKGGENIQERGSKNMVGNRGALASRGAPVFCPKQRSDIRTRVVDGETLVLDRREEFIHQFNTTASYIWERCNGHCTPDQISHELCEAFDVDFHTAHMDVLATIETLRQAKLLEPE
jgi:hypothetical protein